MKFILENFHASSGTNFKRHIFLDSVPLFNTLLLKLPMQLISLVVTLPRIMLLSTRTVNGGNLTIYIEDEEDLAQ